jgi:hypothetical protein
MPHLPVIPAKAGIQTVPKRIGQTKKIWTPACAGVTENGYFNHLLNQAMPRKLLGLFFAQAQTLLQRPLQTVKSIPSPWAAIIKDRVQACVGALILRLDGPILKGQTSPLDERIAHLQVGEFPKVPIARA